MTTDWKFDIDEKIIPEPTEPIPDEDLLWYWLDDGVSEATDGCMVEPDGYCPHGYPSWFLQLGLI